MRDRVERVSNNFYLVISPSPASKMAAQNDTVDGQNRSRLRKKRITAVIRRKEEGTVGR